jgi:predicted nucleotidyltransferase component of viral defense system
MMNSAIAAMLERYELRSVDDSINALREIFQEIALCGLWRGKFHERAAFYGGTALRILYGLDRFSEDMDFSLLVPDARFDLTPYCGFIQEELRAWGFNVEVETRSTKEQLLVIDPGSELASMVHGRRQLKIKIEVDTNPPSGFSTETRFVLMPIPFSVKAFDPPSLFSGKMHALLCRGWQTRVKGRDWYDFVWYVGRGTELDLPHLEARMRQSGHYDESVALDEAAFRAMLAQRISELDVAGAAAEVERFLPDPSTVRVWSREFFTAVAERISIRQ